MDSEIVSSKKRLLGAVVFGLLVSATIRDGLAYSVPYIISIIGHTSMATSESYFHSSIYLGVFLDNIYIFLGAGVAGYLARRKGALAGLLSSSLSILFTAIAFVLILQVGAGTKIGGVPSQLFVLATLAIYVITSTLGGYCGQQIYNPDDDLDLGTDKLTVFGIRWFHYFWILPLVLYPFITAALIAGYAVLSLALSYFYIGIHVSLWYIPMSIEYGFAVPISVFASLSGIAYSFFRFFQIMQKGQNEVRGILKFLKVLAFGVLAPILYSVISGLAAQALNNLPTPAHGDWKIAFIILLGFYAIFVVASLYRWIKQKTASERRVI